jgi:AAA15 family ATPase/GTPase
MEKVGSKIQLISHKNSGEIPFQYESEGIKKIVSILQLLIVVYNKPSITVAIDELDAGVFEYLLGEILRIISEKGKGQLIFTSHNLRPLETLDRGFIAFTTTNPTNRFIRLTNVKANNNLRDFYYRDIVLGEQDEEVYDLTNNSEIAFAFREAGELSGS